MSKIGRDSRCVLLDWGNTLMREFPEYSGPMADWPRVATVPNVEEALLELRPHWTLALATNTVDSDEMAICKALDRVGLRSLLDKVYCYQSIGHSKPAPAFFNHIVEDLRMDRRRIVMVGDGFEKDVLGANGAGIRSIWYNESSDEIRSGKMYKTIRDFRSLPETLVVFDIEEDS